MKKSLFSKALMTAALLALFAFSALAADLTLQFGD